MTPIASATLLKDKETEDMPVKKTERHKEIDCPITKMLADKLLVIRQMRGHTQECVSKAIGIRREALCMIEHGKQHLRVVDMIKLLEFYEVGYESLIGKKYTET